MGILSLLGTSRRTELPGMNRVFISYSRKDTEQMVRIRKDLEANQFRIWVDQKRIMPGDTLSDEIRSAIVNAACVLVLVSSNSAESDWVKQEIALAFEHKIRIIPLLLDGNLAHVRSLKLEHLVFIDLIRNFDYALKDLTNALRKITDPRPGREWTEGYVFDTQADTFSLGPLTSDWYIVDGNGTDPYLPQNIHTHYIDTPLDLPAEFAARRAHIEERETSRAKIGLQSAWNGGLYYLQSVNVGRHGTEEDPIIDMWFGPTDYFTFLATNALLLDQEDSDTAALIERYFVDADWNTPIRYFSNSFGINLAVITSDQKVILAQRSNNVASRPGAIGVSINEGLSRPIDQPNPDLGPGLAVACVVPMKNWASQLTGMR
ncbi:MAG: toll/interleukin-1 receptor domain-containing protein [Anaerolineae bacterium]